MRKTLTRLAEDLPPPPFTGFPPAAFSFFKGLAENQNKTWFDANRHIYESQVRDPLASLIAAVAARLAAHGLHFAGDPRRAMFRLHRDVRFSSDKSPYKTHAGAVMTRDGAKTSPGILYFQIGAGDGFTAAGFYQPEPPVLQALREAIVRDDKAWQKATKNLDLARDDALLRPPKGFTPATDDVAEALKLKSWVVRRPIPQNDMRGPALVDIIADFALTAAPLLKFGWNAIDKRINHD